MKRHRIAKALATAAFALAALAGCGGAPISGHSATAAPMPVYRAGDRWVYNATDGFFRSVESWQETHEITATSGDGISVRVAQQGATRDGTRIEQWSAPVLVRVGALFDNETRRFDTPLERRLFPLTPGRSWSQWVNQFNETASRAGQINHFVRVGGWERVTTPAGSFDAIRLHVVMTLDDEEFWRWPTRCNYLFWYAPEVRGIVRATKEAQYIEKGDRNSSVPIRSQHAVLELASFTPGAQ